YHPSPVYPACLPTTSLPCYFDWSGFLPWVEYAQNSLVQSSLGITPFQCVLGYQPPLFPWDTDPAPVEAVEQWFTRSSRVWDSAHQHLDRASRRQKDQADRRRRPTPLYHPGQRVWLSTRDIRHQLPNRKLSQRYIGPFKIVRRINPVTYRLLLPRQYRLSSSFHVSLSKPVRYSPMHPPVAARTPPPPLEIDGTLPFLSGSCWSRGDDGVFYNIWWIGKGTARRNGLGFLPRMCWILSSSPPSTVTTHTALLLGPVVAPLRGHSVLLEPPSGGGFCCIIRLFTPQCTFSNWYQSITQQT
ncbi:hypothetical protein UPYG_G00042250, partial [Umbra pygmaea]